MVDTLGASVFPFLPKALGQLLAESEVKGTIPILPVYNLHSDFFFVSFVDYRYYYFYFYVILIALWRDNGMRFIVWIICSMVDVLGQEQYHIVNPHQV